jgi:hypothetical protein
MLRKSLHFEPDNCGSSFARRRSETTMDTVRVKVDDLMQQSYVYLLNDPIGRTAPSLSGLATKLKTCAASAQIGRAVRNGSSLQEKEGATGCKLI